MSKFRILPLALSLSLGASTVLPACKSESYESSGSATGKTVQQAADEIDRGIAALDSTTGSLKDLVERPAPDPQPQFKIFAKNLETLEGHAKSVSELSAAMEKNSSAYFAKWDQQIASITNEDIRERSADRREKVEKALAKVRKDYNEARDEFKPLLADLQDVRTALGADLTPDGIGAVKKTSEKIAKRAEDVKETLVDLSKEFRELGVGLGKAAAAAPPPPPK